MSELRIGHLEVDTPWGNAGGVVKTPEEVKQMAQTGVGWIEAGSYTLEPLEGNSPNGETVYYHNPYTGETFNSLGMPNKGMDEVDNQMEDMVKAAHTAGKRPKPLVVNVAPVSEDPVSESQELVERAYRAGADAVLLNAGCPNVITEDGGRKEILSHKAKALGEVITGISSVVEKYHPVFLRTSPYESFSDARRNLRVIDHKLVSAVFTPNTWPGHIPKDGQNNPVLEVPGGAGGKSGPAMAEKAFKQTVWALTCSSIGNRKIDVVSSSGIMTGEELERRIHVGAVAGAGTTLYYESAEEGWSEATDRLIRQYAEAAGAAPSAKQPVNLDY